MSETFNVNPKIVIRKIGRETVLVPVGQSVDEVRNIFTLNESAALILNALKQGKSKVEIHQELQNEYDADEAELMTSLTESIEEFKSNGIVL